MNTTTPTNRTARPNFWLRAIERRKHQLTREYRKSLGAVAREGISDEDYATTMATLEAMARNLGWDETQTPERGHGRGHARGHRGFGPDRDARFGPGRRHFGHDHNGRPGFDEQPANDTTPPAEPFRPGTPEA